MLRDENTGASLGMEWSFPAEDVDHDAVEVSASGFESGTDTWTALNADSVVVQDDANARTGIHALETHNTAAATATVGASRTLTGFTVGREYTVSAWLNNADTNTVADATVGVAGIGTSTPLTAPTATVRQQLGGTRDDVQDAFYQGAATGGAQGVVLGSMSYAFGSALADWAKTAIKGVGDGILRGVTALGRGKLWLRSRRISRKGWLIMLNSNGRLSARSVGALLAVAAGAGAITGSLIVAVVSAASGMNAAFAPTLVLLALVIAAMVGVAVGVATMGAGLLGAAAASVVSPNRAVQSGCGALTAALFAGLIMGLWLGPGLYWNPILSGVIAGGLCGMAIGIAIYLALATREVASRFKGGNPAGG